MGYGSGPAADFFQSVNDAMGAKARALEAETELARTKRLVATIKTVEEWNAGNLAEKHALREALRKLQPDHPLLVNTSLQERIKEAGRRAMTFSDDWDAARQAGESFQY